MNKKELKNIAKKIAEAENILKSSADAETRKKAEDAILTLSGKVTNLADMCVLDDLV